MTVGEAGAAMASHPKFGISDHDKLVDIFTNGMGMTHAQAELRISHMEKHRERVTNNAGAVVHHEQLLSESDPVAPIVHFGDKTPPVVVPEGVRKAQVETMIQRAKDVINDSMSKHLPESPFTPKCPMTGAKYKPLPFVTPEVFPQEYMGEFVDDPSPGHPLADITPVISSIAFVTDMIEATEPTLRDLDKFKTDHHNQGDPMIQPLADRVVIAPLEIESKTNTGLYVPPTTTGNQPIKGTVVSVGAGRKVESGATIAPTVAVGDTVLYPLYGGLEIVDNGRKLTVVREADIIAIVKETV